MAADIPGVKFDTGQTLFDYSANCFPVRSFITKGEDAGAWLVAQRAEQRRRFRAVLCTQPKTYAQIKEERRRAEKEGTSISAQEFDAEEEEKQAEASQLDGFFLMRHCCVEDPSDLCSINIMGKEISEYKEEDLALFDNVAYVNASENFLPLEAFRGFPILRELEMSLNGMRGIHFSMGDFPQLEVLDLSYNNLSQEDILTLGMLSNLKVLHLTGNNFKTLPQNMAVPRLDPVWKAVVPYANLEILMLDDNKLADVSVFATLATMPNLKHLNLEKNEIYLIPMLQSMEGRMFTNEDEREKRRLQRSAKNSARKSARKEKSEVSVTEQKQQDTPDGSKSDEKKENIPIAPPTSKATEKPEPSFEGKADITQENLYMGNLDDLSVQMNDIKINNSTLDKDPSKGSKDTRVSKNILPFPELRHINLAYNKIEDEDALLAVAAWPMLVELVIHNNPLTTENSGDPPLLKRFLGDRLGIKLARKKEPEVSKLHIHVQKKKSRHVDPVVPKIPKLSVDQLLMLEGPPSKTSSALKEATQTDIINNLDIYTKPLPPISPSSGQPEQEEMKSEQPIRAPRPGEEPTDPFFMTQVEDQEGQEEQKRSEKGKKKTKLEKKVDDRYKGYEILLDVEDDPTYQPPKDMQGNIKVLKYALAHELVYRDPAVQLDRISKPVEPYRKTEVDFGPPRKTRQVKIAEALEATRTRLTTEEASLADVLAEQKTKYKGRFKEAENLLHEIQRRYNTVRVNSMKEAKEAKRLIQGAVQDVSKTRSSVRQGKRVQVDV
ncbi:hypothetical protein CHS0354_034913 [Potamilus streckersoni]|uniref:X-ray radiation resistance-associated protein 1 n=1 Tax=Potamilus streckersoni TaxID=2493646 RepID=A0AAE0SDI5_9BIVA|nr:hypothetical protein CHS0354_034913 [Potamilus streckersoni]